MSKSFKRFYRMSGLRLNPAKTELYCGGMTKKARQDMIHLSGFKAGSLPVRYLGLPFVPGRLADKECKPLIEKITARIEGWAHRNSLMRGGYN
ncbi:hypothetical protein CRG98_025324 [Punica granatum]|uniref:Reverse transcriptase domain-containing protein n=1 Tax=Punica granatum TaxID=22663 RepID=A0A2I0JDD3_PUNGR|nr:hypothetical protein CRG98_025324 [Punica granatum]